MPRIRDFNVTPGYLPTGPLNAITDVAGEAKNDKKAGPPRACENIHPDSLYMVQQDFWPGQKVLSGRNRGWDRVHWYNEQ